MDGFIKGQLRGNRNRLVDTSQEFRGGQESLGFRITRVSLLVVDHKFASSQTSHAIPTSLNSQACVGTPFDCKSSKLESSKYHQRIKYHFPPPFRPFFQLYQRLQRSKVTLLAGSQQSLAPLRDCTNFMHRTITGKPSNLQQ